MLDGFDPTTWDVSEQTACFIHLSDRFDVYALVDPIDYEWARHFKWCHTYGSGSYVEKFEDVWVIDRPDHMYARRCVGGKTLWLHREILTRWKGPPRSKHLIGDHKNGKTLDCRRKNLRWATRRQNSQNTVGSKTRARFLRMMGE